MKIKMLIMILLTTSLTACSLDDDDPGKWKPKTTTMEVTIEPEYIFSSTLWATSVLAMEAVDDTGKRMDAFSVNEINGFTYEEGYRYKLLLNATTTDPNIVDCPSHTYALKKLLSKEYVGIRTEGCHEVTMDVQRVLMLTPDGRSSAGYYFLSGRAIDGSETLDMGFNEIIGSDFESFRTFNETTQQFNTYKCRMRLSITPSDRPIYRNHNYRIRLLELLSSEESPNDSIVIATTDEEYLSKY